MKSTTLLILLCSLAHAEPASPSDPEEAAYPAIKRFVEVLETARKRHPDIDKVTYDRLINQALDGMLSSLDPHSSFIHPEMAQLVNPDGNLNNNIPSLGISIGKDSENIFISAIEKSSPAEKSGIIPRTAILAIDGTPLDNLELPEIIRLLQGSPGETTTLTLRNPERPGELEVTLSHRFVETRSIVESKLLEESPKTGYLRLGVFGSGCAREVEAALDDLEDAGMTSLIFDLRENGGGDLDQTVRILGLFVPPATMVVSVRPRTEEEEFLKTPDRQRRRRDYPVSVLVDRNSASASELTAGALHDLKRATVIGEKTYGKGSVQNIVPMGGGTALRLTIATYHTPSGDTPHLKGITPDIMVEFSEEDRMHFLQSARSESLDEKEMEALSKWTDPAIKAALTSMENND
ncbi:MAG: S41 family peptidase [Luteolibacter sp.]